MSRQQIPVFLCLLFGALASAVQAQAGESDCSLRLGGIGVICHVPGRYPTLEIRGAQPHEQGELLLRVT